jgi:hypothetical protein
MNDNPINLKNEDICPYLGLSFDVQTAMENPSLQNYCHNVKPLSPPSLTHQREYCLNVTYSQCKLFSTGFKKPIPADLAARPGKSTKRIPVVLLIFLLLVFLGVFLIASGLLPNWFFPASSGKAINPTVEAVSAIQMPTEEPTVQILMEASEVPTQPGVEEPTPIVETEIQPTTGPTSISSFTEESPHLLLTPFGNERVFLLHRVTGGEDLTTIASKYQTSIEAIRAVNYRMPLELWVDTVIIIPVNQTDVAGVTPMTALEITESGKTIQNMADENGISPEFLGAVNARLTSYSFQTGEWVIIPQPTPFPT